MFMNAVKYSNVNVFTFLALLSISFAFWLQYPASSSNDNTTNKHRGVSTFYYI